MTTQAPTHSPWNQFLGNEGFKSKSINCTNQIDLSDYSI